MFDRPTGSLTGFAQHTVAAAKELQFDWSDRPGMVLIAQPLIRCPLMN